MKKRLQSLVCLTVLLTLQGCDLIDYHPYYTGFDGPKDINARHMARIETDTKGKKRLHFAVLSDTQRWYDETAAAVRDINSRKDVDFVIHCGDLTDFSATKEFELMRDELEKLAMPYVCLIGNHDNLANGPYVFRAMFGKENFSFTAGDTHFVCIDTNALEHDYSTPVPDFAFLEEDISSTATSARRTVVAMHAMPYSDQFNNNVATIFEEKIKEYPGLQFCLCGHNHQTEVLEPFEDGIRYYECGAAKKRQYLLFTLTEEGGVVYEVVDY